MPRAAPTELAVGHDAVLVPEAGVAVDAGADTAAVAVAVPAAALLDVELELVPPQAAAASEPRRRAPAKMPRR
jgi:hypothetical protein